MKTNVDATLYSRIAGTDAYTRSEITGPDGSYGVFWEQRKASNVIRSGLIAADSAVIYIPVDRGDLELKVGDVLVKGIVSDTIHPLIPAQTGPPVVPEIPAFTMSMLRAKYSSAIAIKSIDFADYGSLSLRHWKVSGS